MPNNTNPRYQSGSRGEQRYLNPLSLLLDPENPRLKSSETRSSQEELLKIMIERFKVEELAESIIAAGFIPFDPLVGWEHEGGITILEGNRRVAALKLLLQPSLAPRRHERTWRELSGRLVAERRETMTTVPVTVYRDRREVDLTAYIGFRHVTGVLQWPALEKAKFIAHLIEDIGWDYRVVAERLGSYPRHVERHYVAYRLTRQASENRFPGAEKMETYFGVLMRALQSPGITNFLGLTYPDDPARSRLPVREEEYENFKDFITWTFGTSEKQPLLRDSRHLTRLGKILESAEAVRYLRRNPSPTFDRAWSKSGGQVESLADSLLVAADLLQEAVPLVSEHRDQDEIKDGVRGCTRFLSQILVHFPGIASQYGLKDPDV